MIKRTIKCLSCGNEFEIAIEDDTERRLQDLRQKLVEAGIHQKKAISIFTLDKIFRDVFLEGRKW